MKRRSESIGILHPTRWFMAASIVFSTGCLSRTIEPKSTLSESDACRMDYGDWGTALAQAWDPAGVNYDRLLDDPRPLDRFLARVRSVGPLQCSSVFAERNSRLAYAVNVYNATILRSVCELARNGRAPPELPWGFDTRFRFQVDGQRVTPAELRREVLRLAGQDWRVRLALCDGRAVGPSLSRRVLLPEILDAQLNDIVRTAVENPQVLTLSHGEYKQLLLCRPLYEVREQLVREYEQRTGARGATVLNALLVWMNAPQRQTFNSAVGYDVAMISATAYSNAKDSSLPEREQGLFGKLGSFTLIRPSR